MRPQELHGAKTFPAVPGEEVHFDIEESVEPTKNAYYNVPAAFREKAMQRLDEMEDQGITEKVTEAPRWISVLSLVPKGKSDFRLVVNMRGPNRAIRRAFYRHQERVLPPGPRQRIARAHNVSDGKRNETIHQTYVAG